MSKKKDRGTTAARGKGARSRASSKDKEKTTSYSKLVEKAGFLVYVGPIHGDLSEALGEQLVARLYDIEYKRHRQFGSVKGEIWMSEYFDEPLDDFQEYM